jgi:type IV pilus assembly protein PilP
MRTLTSVSLVAIVASATAILGAQQPKASTQPVKPASPATAAPKPEPAKPEAAKPDAAKAATPQAETFSYDPSGRRDPFLNLVGLQGDARNQRAKGEGGAAGMTISEISVRGVLQSRGKLVAMVMGPDNKTYIVHQGDKLLDGSIKLITPQGLVIEQEVNDPLSVIKQREVRKLLRGLEDAK